MVNQKTLKLRHKSKHIITTLLLLISLFCTLYLPADTRQSNDLVYFVAKLKNKIPNKYSAPTESQIDILRQAVWHILNSEFAGATIAANAVGYTLEAFTHKDDFIYYILKPKDPAHRQWGTYIFYMGGGNTVNTAIEIPHPVSEKNTSRIGIKLLIKLLERSANQTKTFAFFLAGSRRHLCDVATTTGTAFQAIHEETATETTNVIQIHGFNIYKYPQIVVTSGTPVPSTTTDRYVMELMQEFNVGVYDGVQYLKLGSTENLQAQYTNSIGGTFIGIFLNRAVHHSKKMNTPFIDLTETAISETTTVETSNL